MSLVDPTVKRHFIHFVFAAMIGGIIGNFAYDLFKARVLERTVSGYSE